MSCYYSNIVDLIREVTKFDVPVKYNCFKNPSFGIGEYEHDIYPDDMIDNPMFDCNDFITNEHIDLFHIMLPNKIRIPRYCYIVTTEQLKKKGINLNLNRLFMEAFIILHEFGHAHQLFISYKKDVEKYICDSIKNETNRYLIREYGLYNKKEGLLLHKNNFTEKYADEFALKHISKVVELIKITFP